MGMQMGMESNGSIIRTANRMEGMADEWQDGQQWRVVGGAEYAIYVELGTYKMPADRSLRNAIEKVMGNAQKIFDNSASIDDFLKRLAEQVAADYRGNVPVDTGNLRDSIHIEKV